MIIYTIGFTKKTATDFFTILKRSDAKRLIDTRLNNVSQLAGFTKRDDLRYFARQICDMDYQHDLSLAPTAEFLAAYKKGGWSWEKYAEEYLGLLRSRRVQDTLDRAYLNESVLLCSEATPERCHRRLAAEYLALAWSGFEVQHL